MIQKSLYIIVTAFTCLILFLLLPTGAVAGELTLTKNGASDYVIVLSSEASPSEKHAARELQMFVKMISDVTLPIYRDNEEITSPMILVGNGPRLSQIDASIDFSDLGNEGFVIRTRGRHLILAGGRARGTLYAVYAILEEVLGCRWYTHEHSYIPRMSTISIKSQNITQKPAFVQRLLNARDATTDPVWAARNRVNAGARLGIHQGGSVIYQGGHSTYQLVSPYKYFEDHPEYYSLYNGKREWEYRQICASSPEVAKIAAHSVIEWINRSPDGVAYNIGQEDWRNFCTCPECVEINDREESTSGTNIVLTNRAADIVKKVHPDKLVGTFAYQYTLLPPKNLRTRDNVAIRLAIIRGCDAHPVEICPVNADIVESVKSWAKVCDNVFIWDYTNDFSHLLNPFPNWWSNHEDLKLFNKAGIAGVFMQGCSYTESGAMEELQVYVQSKLLWNPNRDVWEIVDDFLNGYYGPAAPAMRNYIDLMQTIVKDLNNHFDLFSPPTVAYCQPEVIEQLESYLDDADRAAKNNSEVLHRLEANRLSMRYIKMTQAITHVKDGQMLKPDMASAAYDDINLHELNDFMETCRHHEIISLNEWGGMFQRHDHMRVNLGTHSPVPVENDLLKMEVLPTIGGRGFSIYDKTRRRNLLSPLHIDANVAPTWNATFMKDGFSFGMANQEIFYSKYLKEHNKLLLTGYLSNNGHFRNPNSFLETREYYLPEGKKEIQITQKFVALKRISRPQSTSAYPVFILGNVQNIQVGIAIDKTMNAFKWEDVSFSPDEPNSFSRTFGEREIRSGSFCIVNTKENIGIMGTFDPAQVSSCGVSVDAVDGTVTMGIRGKQVTYRKGDETVFKYSYKILDEVSNLIR